MKKAVFLAILFFVLAAQQYTIAGINSSQTANDIPLRKDEIQPQPRTLSTEIFTACYDAQTLTINSSDYAGNVQVAITGADGMNCSYSVQSTHAEYIDISTLGGGSYTLTITTSASIYTGNFEL